MMRWFPFAGGSSPFAFPIAIGLGVLVVMAFVVSQFRYVLRRIQDERAQISADQPPPQLGGLYLELVLYGGVAVVVPIATIVLAYTSCVE